MPYCSNCGAEMKGAKIFCPECRYRHNPEQIDKLVRKAKIKGTDPGHEQQQRPERRGSRAPREEQQEEVYEPRKAATTMKEDVEFVRGNQKVTVLKEGCSYCEQTAIRRCFFCYTPLCDIHTDTLKIFVRSNPFGKPIRGCPDCVSERHGQTPTQQEAEKASMFFKVKPYHEWRRIRG